MIDILNSLFDAWSLIISFDREIFSIIGLTLFVTVLSTGISSLLGVPLGILAGSNTFACKKLLLRLIYTFMGIPPVVAGLLVYLFLSRKGPLGGYGLLFTPAAMIIAQTLIIFPVVTGLTAAAVKLKSPAIRETCKGLCLSKIMTYILIFRECKYPIIAALLAGYGRAISEVGAVMLVGGNIQYHTRVITTAIVLETGKGKYDKALALGMLLLVLSFLINWGFQLFQEDK